MTQRPSRGLDDLYLERADRRLLDLVDRAFREAAGKAGPHLECRPGCSSCCVGPFSITALDAWRLRRGMGEMARAAPRRAERIRERARAAVDRLRPGFPGDSRTGSLSGDADAKDRFFRRHSGLPCPALDPESGRCQVYGFRPVPCRTYGPPARFGDRETGPCRLCFTGATPDQAERCRMTPDRDGYEDRLVRRMAAEAGEEIETLIAFALAGGPREGPSGE